MAEVTVSVIVPTYNRPDRIRSCVDALCKLDYPSDLLEIIIVDDGGEIPVSEVLADVKIDFTLKVIRQENAGVSEARNTGVAKASQDLILFTDDDCRPDARWVRALVEEHQKSPMAILGGRTENGLPDNIYSTASQLLNTVVYNFFNRDPRDAYLIASNNMAVPRHLLLNAGGFLTVNTAPGAEDREFVDRWRWLGYPVHYVPQARIWHYHQLTLLTFCRQHWQYGRGAVMYQQITRERDSDGTDFEGSFYLNILKQFIHPDDPLPLHKSLRAGVLLVLSQVVYVLAIVVTLIKQKLNKSLT